MHSHRMSITAPRHDTEKVVTSYIDAMLVYIMTMMVDKMNSAVSWFS